MKFPLSWLKDYIDIDLAPQAIAKILTLAGIEVDSIERAKQGFDKVIVGQVTGVTPHPNADKLCVAEVFDGVAKYQVVCGAPNCHEGMKTAFAQIGASITFPDGEGVKIKRSKIRGVESFGMLCSGVELGISTESEGILEFADHLKLGADVGEMYAEAIFDVSLTPNLNHAASLIGIARELSAQTGIPLKLPPIRVKEEEKQAAAVAEVRVEDPEDCPDYTARVVEGISPEQSPEWMRKRLEACGIRPSFLAVDVTNYVLLETGHPLHAFDLEALAGHEIVVRKANQDETIQTLDGKERVLTPQMLVIADKNHPVALAGVMGGEHSEVKEQTKRILIESAYFRPGSVRRTSKQLGLSTDASRRFERGADPANLVFALDRAAALLQELGNAKVLKGVIRRQSRPIPKVVISCRLNLVNDLLGIKLSLSELESLLNRLAFKTESGGQDVLQVTVPTYRVDVSQEIDLIEEAARLIGYDNIPRRPTLHHASNLPNSPFYVFQEEMRRRLIGEGLQEFMTCDLIGPTILEIAPDPKMPKDSCIHVLNPTSIEQSILRTSLLQGLLQVVKFNHDRENPNIAGFEVGKVHLKSEEQYLEPYVAGIVLSGKSRPHHIDPKPHDFDFYDLKGIIENLLEGLNIRRLSFRFSHLDTFHSGRQALVQVDGMDVGTLGEIHPAIQKKLDVPERIYFAELNLSDLMKAKRGELTLRPIPPYPSSWRDWTVTVQESLYIQELIRSIQHIPSRLLEHVSLIAIYRSKELGEHLKNVTLRFVYRDKEKTVSQEEVEQEHERIINAVKNIVPND